MRIDFSTFFCGKNVNYDAKVEEELERRRMILSEKIIKVRIIN